jgi:hypothetical protein
MMSYMALDGSTAAVGRNARVARRFAWLTLSPAKEWPKPRALAYREATWLSCRKSDMGRSLSCPRRWHVPPSNLTAHV